MANTRDLTQKIRSLENMQKVMRAMNMIATVKLRKLFPGLGALEEYRSALEEFQADFARAFCRQRHVLISGHAQRKTAHVVILTADKGMCGSHNNSVHKALDLLKTRLTLKNCTLELSCIGTKGGNYARRKEYRIFHSTEISERVFGPEALRELSDRIMDRYLAGEVQEIHLIYNRFVNTIQQDTQVRPLFPLKEAHPEPIQPGEAKPKAAPEKNTAHFIPSETAPEDTDFIKPAARNLLLCALKAALADSTLSEQAARMTAMENASNSSKEVIAQYVTLRNRARQGSITNELIEIISGKEALKG